jgi:DNA recombination protein RmuC
MYIPAENVFYETIINDSSTNKDYELLNYAIKRRVILVSPNSFYAYLMAISKGLQGLRIEQNAEKISEELSNIQKMFNNFFDDYSVVGKHINNALGKYNDSAMSAGTIKAQIDRITEQKTELIEK